MKTLKQIHPQIVWQELVQCIEPDPFILLKGSDNHFILGWEFEAELKFERDQFNFEKLQTFLDRFKGHYIFGYLTYDVKNKIENKLTSSNSDLVGFPDAHFVVTKHVIESKDYHLNYFGESSEAEILGIFENVAGAHNSESFSVELTPQTSRTEYLENVRKIKEEIQFGNIYEMNYCVNFYAENAGIRPFETFTKLNDLANAPFSVYFNTGDHVVMCASPERYLQKIGNHLISQPIKGTARRGKTNEEDESIKLELQQNTKERAENIMIVDLVRNDFSKIAAKNSVRVDELCGVYSFKTVHQLISTISCELKSNVTFTDLIRSTFPMGSMTGAPKISAMEIAERTENFRRGLYSGTIGYINPLGDFDFNVVIRTILYNRKTKHVSCSVGGAITINAEPEKEYEECLLKLKALQQALC